MNKVLTTVLLLIASIGLISCSSDVKEPKQTQGELSQQAWDNLPVDYATDEEFFNSTN